MHRHMVNSDSFRKDMLGSEKKSAGDKLLLAIFSYSIETIPNI